MFYLLFANIFCSKFLYRIVLCMNDTNPDLNQYFAHYRIGNQNFKLKISPLASKFTKNKSIKIRRVRGICSIWNLIFFQERYMHSWEARSSCQLSRKRKLAVSQTCSEHTNQVSNCIRGHKNFEIWLLLWDQSVRGSGPLSKQKIPDLLEALLNVRSY